jgi:cephalosporin hydroxylase
MRIVIDSDAGTVQLAETVGSAEYPLFSPEAFRVVSRQFLTLGWNLGHWSTFSWMDRQLLQFPDDVLRLAELFWRLRPDVILETGVYDGGSTLLFTTLCRVAGTGRVISVESEMRPGVREAVQQWGAGLVTVVEADSASPEAAAIVRQAIRPGERVCVFLDSDHTARHVAAELCQYGPLVTSGCYLIVADSNIPELAHTPNGEPCWSSDNPEAAVETFLSGHPEFLRERPPAHFHAGTDFTEVSYFPNTWLRRI